MGWGGGRHTLFIEGDEIVELKIGGIHLMYHHILLNYYNNDVASSLLQIAFLNKGIYLLDCYRNVL